MKPIGSPWGRTGVESVLLFILAIGAVAGAAILVMRAIQQPQRHKRRRERAARHAANVRLWNRLFARHDRRLLTDQRETPERVKL
jgi:peptidoglycan/LPS O-acetylase OafA/YrhL